VSSPVHRPFNAIEGSFIRLDPTWIARYGAASIIMNRIRPDCPLLYSCWPCLPSGMRP